MIQKTVEIKFTARELMLIGQAFVTYCAQKRRAIHSPRFSEEVRKQFEVEAEELDRLAQRIRNTELPL